MEEDRVPAAVAAVAAAAGRTEALRHYTGTGAGTGEVRWAVPVVRGAVGWRDRSTAVDT